MILLYRKTLVHVTCSSDILHSTTRILYFLQNNPLSSPSSVKSNSTHPNQHSFTVSYLINSCGFTPEQAQSASRFVKFKTPDKPDSVLTFFKNHGFSKTQISTVTRKVPTLLLSNPKKTLLPKFEFFYSIGISAADLAKALTSNPMPLRRSLKNQIIPSFNFLKNLLHSDAIFLAAFKRFPDIVALNHNSSTIPNIEIMRQHGVPESNIVFLFTNQPRRFMICKSEHFKEMVDEVKKMGFNPLKIQFVLAVHAMTSMSQLTWQKKVEVYKKWGWSDKETILAFGRSPGCMMISEEKITAVMDFFVNTMGWESSLIARRPQLLSLSLEKRIVPRCSVVQVLLSKGLMKKRLSRLTLLESSESWFLKKFVTCYDEEAPQLLKLYQDKMGIHK